MQFRLLISIFRPLLMTPEAIQALIETGFEEAEARVSGADGVHFEAVVISPAFEGLGTLKRHRLVYGTLGERMGNEIHALSLKTFTPDEWRQAPST